jgi:hypothetical protein
VQLCAAASRCLCVYMRLCVCARARAWLRVCMRMRASECVCAMCMVVHACVMRACVWRCIAVRACACTCGLFARANMCLCVHVPCTGDYRLVSSSAVLAQRAAVRRPGSGHIQQPRLGHIRRTHPTLSRYTQGAHALPRGQRNRMRRQRGSHPIPQPTLGARYTALRREGLALCVLRWHACVASFSWRRFGCTSEPRPSSASVS